MRPSSIRSTVQRYDPAMQTCAIRETSAVRRDRSCSQSGCRRPEPRLACGDVREPDRRARRRRQHAHGGRKGAPNRLLQPGERVVLADIEGPGTIRHIWMTFPPAPTRTDARAVPRGVLRRRSTSRASRCRASTSSGSRTVARSRTRSALTAAQEGRGFNSYVPMPFGRKVRVELVNGSPRRTMLYYQIDYTLQPELPAELGRAARRRSGARTRR